MLQGVKEARRERFSTILFRYILSQVAGPILLEVRPQIVSSITAFARQVGYPTQQSRAPNVPATLPHPYFAEHRHIVTPRVWVRSVQPRRESDDNTGPRRRRARLGSEPEARALEHKGHGLPGAGKHSKESCLYETVEYLAWGL